MKSGTAQKMVLNMISTALMIRMGRVKGNRMIRMQLKNAAALLIIPGCEKLFQRGGDNADILRLEGRERLRIPGRSGSGNRSGRRISRGITRGNPMGIGRRISKATIRQGTGDRTGRLLRAGRSRLGPGLRRDGGAETWRIAAGTDRLHPLLPGHLMTGRRCILPGRPGTSSGSLIGGMRVETRRIRIVPGGLETGAGLLRGSGLFLPGRLSRLLHLLPGRLNRLRRRNIGGSIDGSRQKIFNNSGLINAGAQNDFILFGQLTQLENGHGG
jgi:hypothetical protein